MKKAGPCEPAMLSGGTTISKNRAVKVRADYFYINSMIDIVDFTLFFISPFFHNVFISHRWYPFLFLYHLHWYSISSFKFAIYQLLWYNFFCFWFLLYITLLIYTGFCAGICISHSWYIIYTFYIYIVIYFLYWYNFQKRYIIKSTFQKLEFRAGNAFFFPNFFCFLLLLSFPCFNMSNCILFM